jgi:hypothetical protein
MVISPNVGGSTLGHDHLAYPFVCTYNRVTRHALSFTVTYSWEVRHQFCDKRLPPSSARSEVWLVCCGAQAVNRPPGGSWYDFACTENERAGLPCETRRDGTAFRSMNLGLHGCFGIILSMKLAANDLRWKVTGRNSKLPASSQECLAFRCQD